MVVMRAGKPAWACDLCYDAIRGSPGQALYTVPSGRTHSPQLVVVCGGACAIMAETRFTAGSIKRLDWSAFIQSLVEEGTYAAP